MTFVEKWAAKIGWMGALLIALALSVAGNVWLIYRAGGASNKCDGRITDLQAATANAAAAQDSEAIGIARSTTERADNDTTRIQTETVRYVDRIRTVEIPVPAECDGPMPERVQDALRDAAAAAEGRLRAG